MYHLNDYKMVESARFPLAAQISTDKAQINTDAVDANLLQYPACWQTASVLSIFYLLAR